jgi:hypothetical protein
MQAPQEEYKFAAGSYGAWRNSVRKLTNWLNGLSDFQVGLLIFCISMCTRGLLILWSHSFNIDRTESVNVATSLATTGRFANPFGTAATGPTAHLAPVYPFLLSLLYRLDNGGLAFCVAKRALSTIFASLQYALLPYAARTFRLPGFVGISAGIVAAMLPVRMWVETSGGHETTLTALACVGLIPWTFRLLHATHVGTLQKAACGFAWGVAFLSNPVFMPVLVGLLLVSFLTVRPRPVLSFSFQLFLFAFVIVCPWLVRNYVVMGAFSPIRDNFGLELSVSNDDYATAIMDWNVSAPVFPHPFNDTAEGQRMQSMGETAYYHSRLHEGVQWIQQHSRPFAALTARRIIFFWLDPANGILKNLFMATLTLFGVAGMIFLWKKDTPTAAVILVLWLSYQVPYYFVQVSPRYRYPIDWSFWLLSAYAVWMVQARLRPKQQLVQPPSGIGKEDRSMKMHA